MRKMFYVDEQFEADLELLQKQVLESFGMPISRSRVVMWAVGYLAQNIKDEDTGDTTIHPNPRAQ